MIVFSCSHCGMKFEVKPEFAGRSTRCPTCKQPLLVPNLDRTEAYTPPAQLDGALSSLAQAGVEGGVTLDHADSADPSGRQQVRELLTRRGADGQRYVLGDEIARGGMGAVLRAVDCDIRREVAVKFMLHQADHAKKLRFIEEAQITGQLEHPNASVESLRRDIERFQEGRSVSAKEDTRREMLNIQGIGVRDLSQLKSMPLTWLVLAHCGVGDLAPLKGMPLTSLDLHYCPPLSDLSPLKGMLLTSLDLHECGQVSDLSALTGMPLTNLFLHHCWLIRDVTPLQGMNLVSLSLTPNQITKGMDVLRHMKSLKTIGIGNVEKERFSAEEFWKKYDAGEFKQPQP